MTESVKHFAYNLNEHINHVQHSPHFIDKETEPYLSDFAKVTQILHGIVNIVIQVLSLKHFLITMCE